MRRLMRRGLKTQPMIARALNARGLSTPGLGRAARNVSRVLATASSRRICRAAKTKLFHKQTRPPWPSSRTAFLDDPVGHQVYV